MQHKIHIIILLVGMMLFGFSTTAISQAKLPAPSPMAPSVIIYTGNVTIEPNGTIQGTNPGSIPISVSGNTYTFNGQINGSLTILRSGAIVNGQNFSLVTKSSKTFAAMALENATNVQVLNFNLSYGGPNFGVFLNNTSKDFLNHIIEIGYYVGFQVLNYTQNINISNSQGFDSFVSLATGVSPSGSPSDFASTSSNITIYNFTSDFSEVGILIATQYSSIIDSSLSQFFAGGIFSAANNTLFSGNKINVTYSDSGFITATGISGLTFHNVSFMNNIIRDNAPTSPSTTLISYQNISGEISGNTINANASGKQVTAVNVVNGMVSVSGNTINITNAGHIAALNTTGLTFSGGSYNVLDNRISISGQNATGIGTENPGLSSGDTTTDATVSGNTLNIHVSSGYGILMNTTGSMISNNAVYMNTTYGFIFAIAINGFNNSIIGNDVTLFLYNSSTLLATGIGNITGLDGYFGNLSINDNSISLEFSSVAFFKNNEFEGVSYQSSSAENLSINGNTITEPMYFGLAGLPAIYVVIKGGIQISDNLVNASGGILALGNDSTISFNNVTFMNPGIGFGGAYSVVNNALILDNTLNCLFDGSFSIAGDLQNNVTIEGNYFYGNLINIGLGGGVSNSTIYHNDFFNASAIPIELANYGSGPNTNISLNAPYPIGGNYYAGFAGTDLYSGPLQNIKGADGIFDTNYTAKYDPGNVDKYPLAKPWLRPQFIIHESGLLNGAVWSATFNGQTKTSDQSTISFNIVNATYQTYSFSYSSVFGYVGHGSGTYQYTGSNSSSYAATYVPVYTVNFTESGLPAGSTWQISINGILKNITGTYLDIAVNNGTSISYNVRNSTFYYATVGSGQFVVSKNTTVSIEFDHYAYITGSVSPSGAIITVNGEKVNVTNGKFNATLAGGSYEVIVTDNGFSTYYKNISLSPGQSLVLNVSLAKASSTPLLYFYVAIGGIGAVVLIVVAMYFIRKPGKP